MNQNHKGGVVSNAKKPVFLMETFSKHTYSHCDPQVQASSVISINSFPIKYKILHVQENRKYSAHTKLMFIDIISEQNFEFLHECEKSTFKATIGIIYEMTRSEDSQATAYCWLYGCPITS